MKIARIHRTVFICVNRSVYKQFTISHITPSYGKQRMAEENIADRGKTEFNAQLQHPTLHKTIRASRPFKNMSAQKTFMHVTHTAVHSVRALFLFLFVKMFQRNSLLLSQMTQR